MAGGEVDNNNNSDDKESISDEEEGVGGTMAGEKKFNS